jgi:C1A family cysteine protease
MQAKRGYGWIKETPRSSDRRWVNPRLFSAAEPLPELVDLEPRFPPVYDQLQLNSCTGNSVAGVIEFDSIAQGLGSVVPSRLFAYYNGRALEGAANVDGGAQIADVVAGVGQYGIVPESEWPYDPDQVNIQPPAACYTDAAKHVVLDSSRVDQDAGDLEACLADGHPFVFGFVVHSSFESQEVAQSGIVPMPGWFLDPVVGGHAVVVVGYDHAKQLFKVRNSWGQNWGQAGYCYFPYAYLLNQNLSSDFWRILKVQ